MTPEVTRLMPNLYTFTYFINLNSKHTPQKKKSIKPFKWKSFNIQTFKLFQIA